MNLGFMQITNGTYDAVPEKKRAKQPLGLYQLLQQDTFREIRKEHMAIKQLKQQALANEAKKEELELHRIALAADEQLLDALY
jgi:hypothetical protein